MTKNKPTKQTAIKILDLLKHGLVKGLGFPEPGKMCIEAAVCYAMGLPHSDTPSCVAPAVRAFKIGLNDSAWSSNKARAQGLKQIAVAQLGSESIDEALFMKEVARLIIQKVLPISLRASGLEAEALRCELGGTEASAHAAARAADVAADVAAAAGDAGYAAAYAAARAAYAAARAAGYAARAAGYAAGYAARAAADVAAYAAAYAADAAAAGDAAGYAARAAADVAAYAADAAASGDADEILKIAAEVGVAALKTCKSPGCKWLSLCD